MRWFYIGAGLVLLAVLAGIGLVNRYTLLQRGALNPSDVLTYGEWGAPTDGLQCRLIALSYDPVGWPENGVPLCFEIKNVSQGRRVVFFGGPQIPYMPAISTLVHEKDGSVGSWGNSMSESGEWSPSAALAPGESAYRTYTERDSSPQQNEKLKAGAALSAKLMAIGYGDRQKVEVVSGKLVLKPLPGGEGEKGSTQTAP